MDLTKRVERLERRNQQLQYLLAAALAALPIGWVSQQVRAQSGANAGPAEISEKINLKSASGAVVASLFATAEGSKLSLCDAAGRPRLVLAVGKDGPVVSLLEGDDAAAKPRLALAVTHGAGPSVSLFSDEAKPHLVATLRTKSVGKDAPPQGQLLLVNDKQKPVVFPKSSYTDPAEPPDPDLQLPSNKKIQTIPKPDG